MRSIIALNSSPARFMMRPKHRSQTWKKWKNMAMQFRLQTLALYFAYRDPRTPWFAKWFALAVVAYALSPIDLIPDFVPVLGYLDDLVLIPLGVFLAMKMISPVVMEDCKAKAKDLAGIDKPEFKWMGVVVIGVWLLCILLVGFFLFKNID